MLLPFSGISMLPENEYSRPLMTVDKSYEKEVKKKKEVNKMNKSLI